MCRFRQSVTAALFLLGIITNFSCTEQYLLQEPPSENAIRIIVIQNELETYATALSGDDPLEYDLRKAFQAELNTRAWLFHYDKADLVRNYPLLTRYNDQDLAFVLKPIVSNDTGFPAPPTNAVWKTEQITKESSDGALSYEETSWENWSNEQALLGTRTLRFQFSDTIGCPLPATEMRLFSLDDPTNACSVQRDSSCNWAFLNCDDDQLTKMCKNLSTRGSIFQNAAGDLLFDNFSCVAQKEIEPLSGTIERWSCNANICGELDKQLGVQNSVQITSEKIEWKAVNVTEGMDSFVENTKMFSHNDTLYEALRKNEKVLMNIYQWVVSLNGTREILDKKEVLLSTETGFDVAQDGKLRNLVGARFNRNFVLEFSKATYLIANRSDMPSNPSEIDLEVTTRIAHGSQFGESTLLNNPTITPSYWQQNRFFALTQSGIGLLSTDGILTNTTPNAAEVVFDETEKKVFVGFIEDQEHVFVCEVKAVGAQICENKVFVFKSNGEFRGTITVPHKIIFISSNGEAILLKDDSVLQVVQLSSNSFRILRNEIIIPGLGASLWSTNAELDFLINSDFGGHTAEKGKASFAIGMNGFGGVIDLASGLSTGVSVFLDGEQMNIRGMIRNILDSKHYVLFESQSDPVKFQWISLPIIN